MTLFLIYVYLAIYVCCALSLDTLFQFGKSTIWYIYNKNFVRPRGYIRLYRPVSLYSPPV
jgi:hypothetical protein